jgi:hypothetical protein
MHPVSKDKAGFNSRRRDLQAPMAAQATGCIIF